MMSLVYLYSYIYIYITVDGERESSLLIVCIQWWLVREDFKDQRPEDDQTNSTELHTDWQTTSSTAAELWAGSLSPRTTVVYMYRANLKIVVMLMCNVVRIY